MRKVKDECPDGRGRSSVNQNLGLVST
jgi:hypothetical protein